MKQPEQMTKVTSLDEARERLERQMETGRYQLAKYKHIDLPEDLIDAATEYQRLADAEIEHQQNVINADEATASHDTLCRQADRILALRKESKEKDAEIQSLRSKLVVNLNDELIDQQAAMQELIKEKDAEIRRLTQDFKKVRALVNELDPLDAAHLRYLDLHEQLNEKDAEIERLKGKKKLSPFKKLEANPDYPDWP